MKLKSVEELLSDVQDVEWRELPVLEKGSSEGRTINEPPPPKPAKLNVSSGEDVSLYTDRCELAEIGYDEDEYDY